MVILTLFINHFLFAQGSLIVDGQIHQRYNDRVIKLYNFIGQHNNVAVQKTLTDTIKNGRFYFKVDSVASMDLYFVSCEIPNKKAVDGRVLKRKSFFVDTGTVTIFLDSNFNKTMKGKYMWDKQYDSLLQYLRSDLYEPREIVNTQVEFIKTNPSSPLSVQNLFLLYNKIHDDQLDSLYGLIPANNFNSSVGKYLKNLLDSTITGKIMSPFQLPDTSGKIVSTTDFKGKYVLFDIWASWCGPCRKENSYIKKLHQKYEGKLEIVQVSLDEDKKKWLQAIQVDKLQSFIHLSDLKGLNGEFAKQFHLYSIPRNMLVDPNGKIIARNLRGKKMLEDVKKLINKID